MAGKKRAAPKAPPPPPPRDSFNDVVDGDDDSSSDDGEMELKPRNPQPEQPTLAPASLVQKKSPPPPPISEIPKADNGSDDPDDEDESVEEDEEAESDNDAREKEMVEKNPNAQLSQKPFAVLPLSSKRIASESGSSSDDDEDSETDDEKDNPGVLSPNLAVKPISSKPMDEHLVNKRKNSPLPLSPVSSEDLGTDDEKENSDVPSPNGPNPVVKPISSKPMDEHLVNKPKNSSLRSSSVINKKKQVVVEKELSEPPATTSQKKLNNVKRKIELQSQKSPPAKVPKVKETGGSYKFLKDVIDSIEDDGIRGLATNHLLKLLGDPAAAALDEKCKKVWFADMKAKVSRMNIMKEVMSALSKTLAKKSP